MRPRPRPFASPGDGAAVRVEKAVVINLARRPDRLQAFRQELAREGWPFPEVQVFTAYDSDRILCPDGWKSGGPAWCCLQSHLQVLRQAMMDGVKTLLVMEDDVALAPFFVGRWQAFMEAVPVDWLGLWCGQHHGRRPQAVCDGVVRARDCQRTHWYVCRGAFLRELYRHWARGAQDVHLDWTVGAVQQRFPVYSPDPNLVGQRADRSDIRCADTPSNWWNPPPARMPVVVVTGPREVMEAARANGLHFGFWHDSHDVDLGLLEVLAGKRTWHKLLVDLTWEVHNGNGKVAGIWHPDRQDLAAEVRRHWDGAVYEEAEEWEKHTHTLATSATS